MGYWEEGMRASAHYHQLGSSREQRRAARVGGRQMGGSREEGRGLGGGILANVERGPIKMKAMGNMNDLRLKHTQGHTYISM